MPYPEKKRQRLQGHHRCTYDEMAVVSDFLASIESLSGDILANIFGFLLPQEIMCVRLNRKMREAAKITIVPPAEFVVDSLRKYNSMSVMATALPNLQKITLGALGENKKYVDGEDPDVEWAIRTASRTACDIGIISNLTKLRELEIKNHVQLNGRYPCFFNFPHLQKLTISALYVSDNESRLKFDLEMLAGLPSLKELNCEYQEHLTGNLNSLRVLKGTLEKLTIDRFSPLVMGNFMDLADFLYLNELDLEGTVVTGDIRDIGENDFPSLEKLILPKSVYGGFACEFQRISDAEDAIRTLYLLSKRRLPNSFIGWYCLLSENSPDRYDVNVFDYDGVYDVYAEDDLAPFFIVLVRAGTRVGYRWETNNGNACEMNWLDPEPDRESADYGKYMEELQRISFHGRPLEERVKIFKGFHQPPTQEEFERILERMHHESDDDSLISNSDSISISESDFIEMEDD